MALQAKVIKQKIKGVGNIRKITRTMEMVSVAKMKKSATATLNLRPFAIESLVLMQSLLSSIEDNNVFTTVNKASEKNLVILVASNKGLCGSYNTNIYRELVKFAKTTKNVEIISIGKQAEKIAKRADLPVLASFIEWGDAPSFEDTEVLMSMSMDIFKKGDYSTVSIIYTEYIKAMTYSTVSRQILPVVGSTISTIVHQEESEIQLATDTLVEPNQKTVFDFVLPRVVHTTIHSAILESLASEHSSRMFAMNTATENAKDMLKLLTISYNRARQDAVTQELAEIAAGSIGK